MNILNKAWSIQARIIWALALHKIKVVKSESKIGYLSVLLKTSVTVIIMLVIRVFIRDKSINGISIVTFIVIGYMLFQIFRNITTKTMNITTSHKNMLKLPNVFPLDIVIAESIVVVATEVICGFILLVGFDALGIKNTLYVDDLLLLFLSILFDVTFSIGCGFVFSTIAIFFPPIIKIVNIVIQILFFISGVFFSVKRYTHIVGDWILYNPVMQFLEMARDACSSSYTAYYHTDYLLIIILPLITISLFFERFSRKYLMQ